MAKNHEYLKGNLNGNRFLHLVSIFHHFFSFLSPPLSLSLFLSSIFPSFYGSLFGLCVLSMLSDNQ